MSSAPKVRKIIDPPKTPETKHPILKEQKLLS